LNLGKSIANEEYALLNELPKEEKFEKWSMNISLRDSHLSELGIKQATKAQQITNNIKIHTVFVSPLRRTLETAYHIFKNHENFENIKFIVVPSLRESLNTVSDIPENIDEVQTEYSKLIPQLDFSMFQQYKNKSLYYIEDMPKEIQIKLSKNLNKTHNFSYKDPVEDISELIRAQNPKKLEGKWNVFNRTCAVKSMVKKYISKNAIPKDQKIVLVTHFVYCYIHTGRWQREYQRDEELPTPDEYIYMNN